MIIEQCSPYQSLLKALKDHLQTQTQIVNETSSKRSHFVYVALKQVLQKQRTKGSVPTL